MARSYESIVGAIQLSEPYLIENSKVSLTDGVSLGRDRILDVFFMEISYLSLKENRK